MGWRKGNNKENQEVRGDETNILQRGGGAFVVGERGRKEEFQQWMASPAGQGLVIAGAVMLVATVILIVVSVRMVMNQAGGGSEWEYSEYDPASDTTIVWMSPTNDESNEPRYVGTEILIENGMTAQQYRLLKKAIEQYTVKNGIELTRVSYLKGSYELEDSYVFNFKVVLNIDGAELKVKLDGSAGWKNLLGAKVYLWDANGEEVGMIEVTDDNICEFVSGVECGDDGA